MAKRILSVGAELADDRIDRVSFNSKTSHLDYDVIVFRPDYEWLLHSTQTYQGKRALTDDSSFSVREACEHWRRELKEAVEQGKVVFVYLCEKQEVHVATGETRTSGTGRNQKVTRIVELYDNYKSIPVNDDFIIAHGTQIQLVGKYHEILSPYWSDFGAISSFNVTLNGEYGETCLTAKGGNRTVGSIIRPKSSTGALFLLPDINFDKDEFFEENSEGDFVFTTSAKQFAKRFIASLIALAESALSVEKKTPPPDWAHDDKYSRAIEIELLQDLIKAESALEEAQKKKERVSSNLAEARILKGLLYEKGKPLEASVISALQILGFDAKNVTEGDIEIDAAFESPLGRVICEVEGKDSKAISIEKLRQISTNVHEDYSREEVDEPSKGVLFGNGFRLTPPDKRETQFTSKCIVASTRTSIALVPTTELFEIAKYLSEHTDEKFCSACVSAIMEGSGLIKLPTIPKSIEPKLGNLSNE